jgi:hypothetical protein
LIVKWAGENAAVIDMQGQARYIARGGEPIAGFAPDVHNAFVAGGTRLGSDASGELRMWEIDARAALGNALNTPENKPIFAPAGDGLKLPIAFDGGLSLMGYDLETGQALDLVTYWRVEHPIAPPLSIFAHAVDTGQQIVAQADGLNVRLSSLESGDIIIQRLPIGPAPTAESINLGVYDPVTMSRRFATLPSGARVDELQIRIR